MISLVKENIISGADYCLIEDNPTLLDDAKFILGNMRAYPYVKGH